MNERESIDVESAYGSEISSNSGFSTKKETFTLEEPTAKHQVWYKWLKYKLREYMVLEAVFLLILVVLLINSYRITSQNEKILATHTMILTLQSQFNSFQKPTTGEDVTNLEEETKEVMEKENEEMKEMLEVLKKVETKISLPTSIYTVVNTTKTLTVSNSSSTSSRTKFNAASLIAGAIVDTSLSSSSNLNPFLRFDQSSMVLVDRPEPPTNKAWCTYEKEPVLTVNLAKYVKPIAVSYQHSKWHGTIPDEAPKIYDVVRCLDYYCEKLEPLVSNCTYRSLLSNMQEQECQISRNISSPIGKLQFRFRKNQGNTEKTCVSLIRVYAETEGIPKIEERSLEDAKTCSDLKYNYHHNRFFYNKFYHKNCTVLYSKECCTECPECCEECEIRDLNERDPILTLQSQFNSFQNPTTVKDVMNLKEETKEVMEKENEEMKEMLEVLKNVETKISSPSPLFTNVNKTNTSTASNDSSTPSLTRFNAASLIAGAIVDTSLSSSSNLNPTFRFDQSSLVLVDRPEPPANKAWCTYEKEPVLTVNLAKYVKPTAVSYQHSKWHGTIPDEAPKMYDVVGCLDYYCEQWEPLASNCTYRSLLSNMQEQECQITRNISSPIGKLQFRFRKNQGNTERTCVSLVRVYAETEEVPTQKLRTLEDTKTCLDLKHDYHHNPITYSSYDYKNCTVLYSKGCCTECPECCEECDIDDLNKMQTGPLLIFFGVILLFAFEFAIVLLCFILCKCY